MDAEVNPLKNIPDPKCATYDNANFSIYVVPVVFAITIADSIMAFGISAMAHVLLVAPVVITVGTFKVAEHKPRMFQWRNDGYYPL